MQFAKREDVAVFIIGHVTKEGAIAGPRVVEHMVDTVLYFENDPASRYTMIRSVKNRFGASGESGGVLLEILDREMNREFLDRYLGAPFDLSRCIFLVTANDGSGNVSVLKNLATGTTGMADQMSSGGFLAFG